MNIDPGKFDRRITFRLPNAGRDPDLGTPLAGPGPVHCTVSAEVQDVLPSRAERLDDTINIQRRPARIRMRWRGDITSDMRIDYDGRVLQIVSGPVELGRRQYLELMAEDQSSAEGVA